jgi:hypothetical protein
MFCSEKDRHAVKTVIKLTQSLSRRQPLPDRVRVLQDSLTLKYHTAGICESVNPNV